MRGTAAKMPESLMELEQFDKVSGACCREDKRGRFSPGAEDSSEPGDRVELVGLAMLAGRFLPTDRWEAGVELFLFSAPRTETTRRDW